MSKESCLICGRLTEQVFCPGCATEGWARYQAIETFLNKYPGVTVIEVCRELSVSLGFIKGLVARGYLNLNLPITDEPEPKNFPSPHRPKNRK